MSAAIGLREDFSAEDLRALARRSRGTRQCQRLLALAAVAEGRSRGEAAEIGGMERQTLRDWVHRFNAEGPAGLLDRKTAGPPPKLTAEQKAELAAIVESGPDHKDGRPRALAPGRPEGGDRGSLRRGLSRALGVAAAPRARLLAPERPSPPSGPEGRSAGGFQKNFPRTLAAAVGHLPAEIPIELWWQDEMRLGQKNALVRQWARKGTRPRQPKDQRYQSLYLFGAICPARGTGAALAMPRANTHAMQAHLREISRQVAPGAHAVLLLDRAGWHTTGELTIPKNITLLFLPSRAPELNPVENLWQVLRQTYLSNRVFETYEEIIQATCEAWNRLIDQPWRIMSIGLRDWAHDGHSL